MNSCFFLSPHFCLNLPLDVFSAPFSTWAGWSPLEFESWPPPAGCPLPGNQPCRLHPQGPRSPWLSSLVSAPGAARGVFPGHRISEVQPVTVSGHFPIFSALLVTMLIAYFVTLAHLSPQNVPPFAHRATRQAGNRTRMCEWQGEMSQMEGSGAQRWGRRQWSTERPPDGTWPCPDPPHARLGTLERIPVVASPRDGPVLVCQAGIRAFGGQHVRQAPRHLRNGGQEVF